jgi:hypothetical protein
LKVKVTVKDGVPSVCVPNEYKCESNNLMVCKSDGSAWQVNKKCTTDQKCNVDKKTCDDLEASDAKVSFKMAFSGIKPGAQCINEYFIPETEVKLDIANIPSNKYEDKIPAKFKETDEIDSKGNRIFEVTDLILDKNKFGSGNNFNYIRIKGPFHLKRRMCQDGQSKKLAETTVCDIDLKAGAGGGGKVYDFSEYTLLSGDVFNGPDGVVNVLDLTYLKTRLNPGREVECGIEGDLNMDGVVNNIDLTLAKDALTERDDE